MSIDDIGVGVIINYMSEWTDKNTGDFVVMDRQTVRAFDRWAIEVIGIQGVVLMENAAKNCTQIIRREFYEEIRQGVCIFCAGGNNGGDGFAIARHLFNYGIDVNVVICADPVKIKGDAKVNYDICQKVNLPVQVLDIESHFLCKDVEDVIGHSGLLVDALLGTGLSGELKDEMALLISSLNSHNIPIVSVDIPSGLDCDTGRPLPVSIEAIATVTFVALKKGFVENPESRRATGRVFVADIGIAPMIRERT
jgi:NAD(P)H-hydrate epimerase